MYMSKDALIQNAMDKINEVANKDFSTISPMTKANDSIALEKLHRGLKPFGVHDPMAGELAEKCMELREGLAMSVPNAPMSTRDRRAKVIAQGINQTGYDIPWMK